MIPALSPEDRAEGLRLAQAVKEADANATGRGDESQILHDQNVLYHAQAALEMWATPDRLLSLLQSAQELARIEAEDLRLVSSGFMGEHETLVRERDALHAEIAACRQLVNELYRNGAAAHAEIATLKARMAKLSAWIAEPDMNGSFHQMIGFCKAHVRRIIEEDL